jgi:hypothetical protein
MRDFQKVFIIQGMQKLKKLSRLFLSEKKTQLSPTILMLHLAANSVKLLETTLETFRWNVSTTCVICRRCLLFIRKKAIIFLPYTMPDALISFLHYVANAGGWDTCGKTASSCAARLIRVASAAGFPIN